MKKIIFIAAVNLLSICILAQNNYQGKLGYGFSPKGHPFDYSQTGAFLQEAANTCGRGTVYANTAWRDSYSSSGLIPRLQKIISSLQPNPYGYTDMVNFGWATYPTLYLNVPGNNTNNWTNSTAKSLFLKMLINFADSLKPAYLFIGNEVSSYWIQDSVDFLNWVSFYHQAYDSVKAHSPATKVGTTFNYEHLAGVGVLNGWKTPFWQALTIFDSKKIDVLGLTLYPFLSYKKADAVPSTYLDPLFERVGSKPLVITETGWPADSLIGVWTSSPQQQVDYVNKLFGIIKGRNVEAVNWLFLNYLMDYRTTVNKIFSSVAMRDSLGNDRPALQVWLSYCNTTSVEDSQSIPYESTLYQNYPNPFNPETVISWRLAVGSFVTLKVYDILGREVATLVDEYKQAGTYNSQLSIINLPAGRQGHQLSSGVYFYRLQAREPMHGSRQSFVQTKKMVLLK
ncbi:MAG: T9SS type A sorting domain-containing protein [Bacteroidota bacterium]